MKFSTPVQVINTCISLIAFNNIFCLFLSNSLNTSSKSNIGFLLYLFFNIFISASLKTKATVLAALENQKF